MKFPSNDSVDKVNKLFIMWPLHYGPEPASIIKTNDWLVDNFKETSHLN